MCIVSAQSNRSRVRCPLDQHCASSVITAIWLLRPSGVVYGTIGVCGQIISIIIGNINTVSKTSITIPIYARSLDWLVGNSETRSLPRGVLHSQIALDHQGSLYNAKDNE
jgi:hypothetical protein